MSDVKSSNGGKLIPVTEGYVIKGGVNQAQSQVTERPAAPAPMKPSASSGPGAGSGKESK